MNILLSTLCMHPDPPPKGTGAPHRAIIDLPDGFEYRAAEMGSATFKANGPISMSFENRYAQFAHIHLNNHGIVKEFGRPLSHV